MLKVLVSRKESIRLAAITPSYLRALIANGRLIEEDALIDGVVRRGVTLESLAAYFRWSPRVVTEVLIMHRVNPHSSGYHYLTGPDG